MSDQLAQAEQSTPQHAARSRRANVMLMALVEPVGGEAQRHRVRDVSAGGLRIDNAASLRAGGSLLVSVGALHAVPATVQWVREGCAGLAFAKPIDPDDARKKPGSPETVAAKPIAGPKRTPADTRRFVPTAGWIGDLRDAYDR